MSQAKLAWAALKNMLRAAARDPLWAFVSLIAAPFRVWKPLLGVLFILIAALFAIGFGGRFFLEQMGFGPGSVPFIALDLFTLLVLVRLDALGRRARRERAMTAGMAVRSSRTTTASAVCKVRSAPAPPMAMPVCAAASAGASLMPSPTTVT